MEPTALISLAKTGVLSLFQPTTIFPSLSLRSSYESVSAKIAIISDAEDISNPVVLRGDVEDPQIPVTIDLRDLSSASVTLLQVTFSGKKSLIALL